MTNSIADAKEMYQELLSRTNGNSIRHYYEGLKHIQSVVSIKRTWKFLEGEYMNPNKGICGNLADYLSTNRSKYNFPDHITIPTLIITSARVIKILGDNWKYKTDDITYPVPHPNKRYTPKIGYEKSQNKWHGRYGRYRMHLLEHCVNKLGEIVNEFEPEAG